MAKVAKKTRNEEPAKENNFNPIKTIAWVLSLIGKPFYFVLSHLILAIIFVLYTTGHFIRISSERTIEFLKGKKKRKTGRKKKEKKKAAKHKFVFAFKFPKIKLPSFKFTFPKIKLPQITRPGVKLFKFKFPDIGKVFKLESLRVSLFELKVVNKTKKFFGKKITRFQKLQLKRKISAVAIFIVFLSFVSYFYFFIFRGLPSPKQLDEIQPQVSTKIYDRNGSLLYKIYKDQNRTIVPLSQIPSHVRLATLAAEDAEFYNHPGFSIRGTTRAILKDIQTGSLQGGSTITQQLVKNVLLSPEKTITRKIKEVILSVEAEATYTKDQIFEMYLNQVSYGGTAYGIEEASYQYFGKSVENLTLAEASYLAGLTQSPTTYSPYGPNPEAGFNRQREILNLMVTNKFITQEQADTAKNEKLVFTPNRNEIKAPHFVMYIRQLLVDKYGEEMVEKGGLEVTTSLDLSKQEMAEKVVRNEVESLKKLRVGNGAALIINPQTGEILAMVGSADYFDSSLDGQVNVTLRIRQPGSSIKVVNYAYALSHGMSPASIINDSPITYVVPGSSPYSPVNYDGQFRGNISLRSALAQSRNIPAVKVLASYGVDKMIEQGQEMGITTWNEPEKYGLSLTLGGGAVTALDLSKVYSTLANYGKRPDTMPILEVKNYKGKVLEKNTPKTTQVLDNRVAFSLTDILKDNIARSPEFGLNSYLVIKNHPEVAVKTGTSNDLRDNWTAGYNQDFLVITWVGNNDNSPMSRIASGVTGASPIWNKIMTSLLSSSPSIDWKAPDGISKVNICTLTGTLPCNGCPTKQEWFLDELKPTKACSQEQVEKITNPTQNNNGANGFNPILDSGASTTNH